MTKSTKHTYDITLEGRTYRVEVVSVGEGSAVVTVDGRRHEIQIERGAESSVGEESINAPITPTGGRPEFRPDQPPRASSSEQILVAPMPGDILAIKVQPGERVALGQELLLLEAMKMKSAIRSAREGIIESIEVQEGESVSYGQPLLTYR